jgi:hypothetical protein
MTPSKTSSEKSNLLCTDLYFAMNVLSLYYPLIKSQIKYWTRSCLIAQCFRQSKVGLRKFNTRFSKNFEDLFMLLSYFCNY